MKYKNPLQVYPWSFLDRLKVAKFVLSPANRLTFGPKTQEWEKQFEDFCGGEVNCVATSSGSSALTVMLEVFLQANQINPKDTTFFCNSTSWGSNPSCLIMRGCGVEFVDINLTDLCFDYDKLAATVKRNKSKVKVIWVTSLIGFSPNVDRLKQIAKENGAYLFADLCESTGSFYKGKPLLSCFDMAVTSGFIAHIISGIEAGMLFINKDLDHYYDVAKCVRNHGLVRGLPENNITRLTAEKLNPNIDPQFLFEFIGSNFRISDLHSYYAILDTKRLQKYLLHRWKIGTYFLGKLDPNKYKTDFSDEVSYFCLPIFLREGNINELKAKLNKNGWETRPIISFLPINPAFKFLNKKKKYPNSQTLYEKSCYVGLNNNLTIKDVDKLLNILNQELLRNYD